MNESELKLYCLEHAGEILPAEAEALLQRDPELKRQVDHLITVSKLISLKQYERPADAAIARCLRGVREQIEHPPVSAWSRLRAWFEFEQPAMAYGMAALALAVVGGFIAINRPVSEGPVVAAEIPLIVEPVVMVADAADDSAEEILASIDTSPFASDKPWIFLGPDTTNIQPTRAGMTIGGGQLVPVSFEY